LSYSRKQSNRAFGPVHKEEIINIPTCVEYA